MMAIAAVYFAAIALMLLQSLFWMLLGVTMLIAAWVLFALATLWTALSTRKPNGLVRHG